jgi:hypothetical protein
VQHKAQWASERGVRSLTRMKRSISDLPPEIGFLEKNGAIFIAIFLLRRLISPRDYSLNRHLVIAPQVLLNES